MVFFFSNRFKQIWKASHPSRFPAMLAFPVTRLCHLQGVPSSCAGHFPPSSGHFRVFPAVSTQTDVSPELGAGNLDSGTQPTFIRGEGASGNLAHSPLRRPQSSLVTPAFPGCLISNKKGHCLRIIPGELLQGR